MRNNFIALLLSLLVHIVIFLLLLLEFKKDDVYQPPKYGTKEGERINIKNFKFSQAAQMIPPQNNAQMLESPLTQPSNTQSQPQQESNKNQKEEQTEIAQTTPPKQTKEKSPTKITKPKKTEDSRKIQSKSSNQSNHNQNSLASSLKSSQIGPMLDNKPSSPSIYDYGKDMGNQEIKELYGDDLYSLNLEERKFIEDNLSGIGRITQKYLKYPQLAGQMGQQGDNIVEFYLHPNGDISDLKLLTPSGYRLLDENRIHTIEIAYKDYPYPAVKTKIRIRVMYRIY